MKVVTFLDLDGVLADFDAALPEDQRAQSAADYDPPAMFEPGFFRKLGVVPGASAAVSQLLRDPRFDLYIGSKPTTRTLTCATEKYEWVNEHFPPLIKRVVLACDKRLLRGDVLVDDDTKWATGFHGFFLHFNRLQPEKSWSDALVTLDKIAKHYSDEAATSYWKS